MILLKIYKDDSHTGKSPRGISVAEFSTMEKAIRAGQNSGCFFEAVDMASGRIIDWNEVNYKAEDDWYYDEAELIWKKRPAETMPEQGKSTFDWLFGVTVENQALRLSY